MIFSWSQWKTLRAIKKSFQLATDGSRPSCGPGQRYHINRITFNGLVYNLFLFSFLLSSFASFSHNQVFRFYYGEYKIFYCAICSSAISFIRSHSMQFETGCPFRFSFARSLFLFWCNLCVAFRALYLCNFTLLLRLINISKAEFSFIHYARHIFF